MGSNPTVEEISSEMIIGIVRIEVRGGEAMNYELLEKAHAFVAKS